MRSILLFIPIIALFLFSCERPSSPDFQTQQTFDIPLVKNMSYKLLGDGDGAIIDTTAEDFEETFLVDNESGLVTLSSEIDFGIGDFDDIVPEIDVDPTEVETEIGLLSVDDFSSDFSSEVGDFENESEILDPEEAEVGIFEVAFDGSGSADFEEVTGSPPTLSPGDPINEPAQPVVVIIDLDTDDFERAEVESGGMYFEFENNLGFNLTDLSATLLVNYDDLSGTGDARGSQLLLGDVAHGETKQGTIVFTPGEELIVDLALEVEIDWNDQFMAATPGDLDVTAEDDELEVRNATANIRAQSLSPNTEDLLISNPNFEYAIVISNPEPGDEFSLIIEIANNTTLPITDSTQSGMPGITIFNSDGQVLEGPKTFVNQTDPSNQNFLGDGQTAEVVIDLTGERLTRELSYDLDFGTSGGNSLEVDQNDLFLITSQTTDLKFLEARSDVDPQSDIPLEDVKDVEGDFVDAEVETGTLTLVFTNEGNIPVEIDHLRFYNDSEFVAKNTGRFFADGSDIGEINNVPVPPQSSVTEHIPLEGVGISNRIAYNGTASSAGSATPVTVFSTDLIITDLEGEVELSSASSVLEPQEFTSSGDVEISEDDFLLTTEDHFVDIKSGMLRIREIINEIDMDIDTLIISFPNLRTGAYGIGDSLTIMLTGDNRILRSSNSQVGQPEIAEPLDDVRLFAPGNKVVYNVWAITENSRESVGDDTVRTVNASERFIASVDIEDLTIASAYGEVQRRVELLNDDEGEDGILDLFNDNEADVTEISDLEEFSDRISGIQLFNPGFDLIYDTNLGVKGTIVAAIVGINKNGEEIYLTGKPGTDLEVQQGDDYQGLYARGAQVDRSDLITFDVEPADNIGDFRENSVIRFDSDNSNVADFLSNLPTEIRFVGKVIANPDSEVGFIVDPVQFETKMGIDIPINLSTAAGEPARIEDTISADLSDLPSSEDDVSISEMTLFITYDNGLPFETDFDMYFLDENENPITNAAGVSLKPVNFSLEAARVDENSRFVIQARSSVTEIELTADQFDSINRTRNIKLDGKMATSRDDVSGEVKLKADDFIKLNISASVKTSISVK